MLVLFDACGALRDLELDVVLDVAQLLGSSGLSVAPRATAPSMTGMKCSSCVPTA